jgi:type II restriction enzyme
LGEFFWGVVLYVRGFFKWKSGLYLKNQVNFVGGNKMNLKEYIESSPPERLNIFMNSLSTTNRTPEYYVNWEKVDRETKEYELELNTLNYLIGKDNIVEEAINLFLKQPNLLRAIPSLVASRDKRLDILVLDSTDRMEFFELDFNNIDISKLDLYIDFIEKSGLFNFLRNSIQRNLVDFVYGVETGLDSNARKNRSGTTMEGILERKVLSTCQKLGFEHRTQATAKWMLENWGISVPVDKSERRFDEAIFDPNSKTVYVLETNYYGGGGSKLKAVAGEFRSLDQLIKTSEFDIFFIWVTDGQGWKTARLPLSEAFEEIDYIFNLDMLRKNYLEDLIK